MDTIRFIKTNKSFYNKIVLLWLKFRQVHSTRMTQADLRDEFTKYACTKLLIPQQSARLKVVTFTARIIFDEYLLQKSAGQHCSFFANVKSSLLFNWESEIVAKSSNFKRNSSL